MHRSALALVALLALVAAPFPAAPGVASCAAPYLQETSSLILQRGARASVAGRAFVDGCQDSMSCSGTLGCQSCAYDDPAPAALKDVGLRLNQGERTWTLDVADAGTAGEDHLGWIRWEFNVPVDAEPGAATVVAEYAEPLRVTVR